MIIQKIHFSELTTGEALFVGFARFVFFTKTLSRFSTMTVSLTTSTFVFCTAIASRLLPRSLSVTTLWKSVSPASLVRT